MECKIERMSREIELKKIVPPRIISWASGLWLVPKNYNARFRMDKGLIVLIGIESGEIKLVNNDCLVEDLGSHDDFVITRKKQENEAEPNK